MSSSEPSENRFLCENFLVANDPNEDYRQWKNFLRQWYLHGPFAMTPEVRSAAEAGRWDEALDAEVVAGEVELEPRVKPVADPRRMVEHGAWMRWETFLRQTHWRYPEKVMACAVLHEWYYPRTPAFPQWTLPPAHIHLPIEQYSKEDVLAPFWIGPLGTGEAHCPRCESELARRPDSCPSCRQRLGGYDTYSARGWPRKAPGADLPAFDDEYAVYFIAARVHVPADMTCLDLWVGCDCRYTLRLNGTEIGRYGGEPRWCQWDMDRYARVRLSKGWNLLLVKLAHETAAKDQTTFMGRFAQPDGRLVAVQDFAREDLAPETRLRIRACAPVPIGTCDDVPMLRRFPDGTLVCNTFRSTDDGKSWSPCVKLVSHELDGRWDDAEPADPHSWGRRQDPATLILREKCSEIGKGVYRGALCRSLDGWATREALDVTIRIPDGTNVVDEANREAGPGCIMGTNIVALPGGDLLVPMYAGLRQDVVWFDYRVFGGYLKYPQEWPRQFKYRSWLLRSRDGGLNWDYFSTIAALPELGDEGFCEPNVELLADGSLLAVLRNGGGDLGPLWIARSGDGGRTWSYPVRTTLTGNYPSLIQLSNSVLACLYGRPNNRVSFDLTGTGLAWSHTLVVANCRGNDHVEACEIAPGELLCVYEDNERNAAGVMLAGGMRQWYSLRVHTERLQ